MDAACGAKKGADAEQETHRLGDAEDGAGNAVRVVADRDVWSRFVEVVDDEGATSGSEQKDARCRELLHHARQTIRRTRVDRTDRCRLYIHAADRFGNKRSRVHELVLRIKAATAYAPATATVSNDEWM